MSANRQFESSPMMRALAAAVMARVPTLIEGNPGLSKTASIAGAARQWGRHVETIIGSSRQSADFLGNMIQRADDTIAYTTFGWVKRLNDAPAGLLLLDEFNTASPSTMNAMQRVLQEGFVGETELGPNVAIIGLMNNTKVMPDANDLTAPMANRVMHLKWQFDAKLWMENVATNFKFVQYPSLEKMVRADPENGRVLAAARITAFLHENPALLESTPPTDMMQAAGAWPSPRAWTNIIETLAYVQTGDGSTELIVIKGLVGEAAARTFVEWEATAGLHNPLDVLADPTIVDWANERADRLFLLANSVSSLGLSDKEHWKPALAALTYAATKGKADIAEVGTMRLLNNRPSGVKSIPASTLAAYADLLEKMDYSVTGLAQKAA